MKKEFNDVLDEEKLNKIKHFCSEANANAQIGGGIDVTTNTQIRNALVSTVSDDDLSYSNMYAGILWEKSKEYLKSFGKQLQFYEDHFDSAFKIEPISFLKYKPGYFYKLHSDEAFLSQCQPDFARELSYVFFVNENFSGGGLSFPNQRKIIKPKANTLIIFPSNWCFPHEVLPVTRGIRYSAVTWGGRIT